MHEVAWHEKAPQGKMDLVVDLNFRMDTSALYSDIVLPAATLVREGRSELDRHAHLHPSAVGGGAAVLGIEERLADLPHDRASKFSELAARHFPEPVEDMVAVPLAHDTPAEIAQPQDRRLDRRRSAKPIPGKTMPGLKVVPRDYRNLYNQFISFGPQRASNGLGAHGTHYEIEDVYDEALRELPTVETGTASKYPSLCEDEQVCNTILRFATRDQRRACLPRVQEHGGQGRPAAGPPRREESAGVAGRITRTLQAQPHRLLNSPMWSGLTEDGRAYAPFTYNVEIPGAVAHADRAPAPLSGSSGLHRIRRAPADLQAANRSAGVRRSAVHDKTEGQPLDAELPDAARQMAHPLHLRRQPPHDYAVARRRAAVDERPATPREIGIEDNDWVEVYNDNGVVVTRAAVSARIPRGICIQYHSPERTLSVPKSPLRKIGAPAGTTASPESG